MAKDTDHGFVYLVTNGDFERLGTYKIGKTISVEQRLANFNSSTESLPDWRAIAYIESDNMSALESIFHFIFREQRRSSRREMFDFSEDRDDGFSLDEVISMFERQAALIGGTFTLVEDPTDVEQTCNQPKNKFQLKWIGANAGDLIVWKSSDGKFTQNFYLSAKTGAFGRRYLVDDPSLVDSTDPSVYQSLSMWGSHLKQRFPGLTAEDYWSKTNWSFNGKTFKDFADEHIQD